MKYKELVIGVYEGCYRIAETMQSGSYTRDLSLFLNRFLTNRIQGAWDEIKERGSNPSQNSRDLVEIIRKIDKKYYSKFERLINKQKGLEHK